MTLRVQLKDLYVDPISHEMMNDPYINASCGHTFEKSQIDGWIATCLNGNKIPDCPLCKKPIANLAPNIGVKQAIDILNDPTNSLIGRVEDLTNEEKDSVILAAETIKTKREADRILGIPDRLPKPMSFPSRVLKAYKDFYKC